MTSPNPWIEFKLRLRSDHPELLVGLDFWVQLGLLSEAQVEEVCRRSLTCPLPDLQPSTLQIFDAQTDFLPPDFDLPVSRSPLPEITPPLVNPSWLTQILTSFMAEISVVWLLFLGVFLVVVSSGVLAASQWQNFPPLGQYGILWGYTLAFGMAGLWAGQRMQMTGQMLRLATLLIIPVNFWMIDAFKLWESGLGAGVGAIAALSLSLMTQRFLRQSSRLTQLNQLALCGLQWGWGMPGLALVAAYGATVGTAGLQVWQRRRDGDFFEMPAMGRQEPGIDLGWVAIAGSLLLLLGRALLIQKIPISDLGLAFGICGWLLSWINRQQSRPLWTPIGMGLLLLGWAVTVTDNHLWQALGVSILGLSLLIERLRRLWRVPELVALILVGFQTYALLQVIFPPSVRSGVISWIAARAELAFGAWELTGLGFFAYLLILAIGAAYLRHVQQPRLAVLTDRFTLGLGLLLFIPSCFNPLVRTIYLSLSTVLLGTVLWQRSLPSRSLVYLTHITGVLTLFSGIRWVFPSLDVYGGSLVLLSVAIAEWVFYEISRHEDWKSSAGAIATSLTVLNLSLWTLWVSEVIFSQKLEIAWQVPTVIGVWIGAIVWRTFRSYQAIQNESPPHVFLSVNAGLLGIAWATELFMTSLVYYLNGDWESWAIANIVLGLSTQLIGDGWQRSSQQPYWKSLHAIPILYTVLGLSVAHLELTATTGFYTLASALTFIGVGRRAPEFKLLTYLGILGISVALYEGLINQLLQASGGVPGDGLTILALPAAAIAILYRLISRPLQPYWRLSPSEVQAFTALHWLGGVGLSSLAVVSGVSDRGIGLWLGVLALLVGYALWVGRTQPQWVYAGVFEASVAIGYGLYRFFPDAFVAWGGAIAASALAVLLYGLPWSRWGWLPAPWRRSAKVLPGAAVILTSLGITVPALLITAAFYAWIARVSRQVRLSYWGLLIADWGIFREMSQRSLLHPLWYAAVVSLSVLYIVQVDPYLQSSTEKNSRHLLRCLALGFVSLTALYQSGSSWSQGLFIVGLSLGFIAVGLTLRVRAFLFVGTLLFLTQVLRQLWLFIDDYSMMLWGLGIALGLVLIWIAATFETRRSQAIDLMQYWAAELDRWE